MAGAGARQRPEPREVTPHVRGVHTPFRPAAGQTGGGFKAVESPMESSNEFTAVQPAKPVAPYVGGKRALAGRLVQLIETIHHDTYAEPFVGMGGVFLRRRSKPRAEVINDASGDVANLFRILQRHYVAFLDELRFGITSRREFERLTAANPATLTDLERAARFLYLQRTAFGGKVDGRSFGVSYGAPGRFDVTKLQPLLEAVHERLAGVVIEQLGYGDFIARYDRPGVLFFLDPPYWGSEGYYGEALFSRADFELLRGLLERLQGRFVLTINDVAETRELFARFDIQDAALNYRVSGKVTEARELIVMGGGA